ncbi:hypothetical protein QBC39DRAFT_361626 [Podospora conica]|nr:hypothetical protein QBC39DRAFT_361626 [Schizothecium conicum]
MGAALCAPKSCQHPDAYRTATCDLCQMAPPWGQMKILLSLQRRSRSRRHVSAHLDRRRGLDCQHLSSGQKTEHWITPHAAWVLGFLSGHWYFARPFFPFSAWVSGPNQLLGVFLRFVMGRRSDGRDRLGPPQALLLPIAVGATSPRHGRRPQPHATQRVVPDPPFFRLLPTAQRLDAARERQHRRRWRHDGVPSDWENRKARCREESMIDLGGQIVRMRDVDGGERLPAVMDLGRGGGSSSSGAGAGSGPGVGVVPTGVSNRPPCTTAPPSEGDMSCMDKWLGRLAGLWSAWTGISRFGMSVTLLVVAGDYVIGQ